MGDLSNHECDWLTSESRQNALSLQIFLCNYSNNKDTFLCVQITAHDHLQTKHTFIKYYH